MILALAGCNQIYGLDQTKARDAAPREFFDAPPDAPFACPGPGGEPRFKPMVSQLPVGQCVSYTPSHQTQTAVAYCEAAGIAEGPIDGALAITVPPAVKLLREPRLFPEGDRMFVRDPVANRMDVYARSGDTWSFVSTIQTMLPEIWNISNPSRGPDRRAIMIEHVQLLGYFLTEYVEQAGTWMALPRYSLNNASFAMHPSLSSDGLRLVFHATSDVGVFFASRATLADRFDNPILLTTVPKHAKHVFLEDDCSRLYFSAIDTVFSLQQE